VTTANDLTAVALGALTKAGCFVWRQNNVNVRGRTFRGLKGVPDIIGVAPDGRFIGVEIKAEGDRISQPQMDFASAVVARGGRCFVLKDVDCLRPILKALRCRK
jgi:hypothetical protein